MEINANDANKLKWSREAMQRENVFVLNAA